MNDDKDAHTHHNSTDKPIKSIRRAGTKNVIISVCVAVTTYYSLTLIAKTFGGSLGSDAYFLLVSLSNLASGIISSLLGTVFLPAFVKLLGKPDKSEAHQFASSIFSWCFAISSLVAIPIYFWNEQFFLLASRFNQMQITQMYEIFLYFAPIFFVGVLSEFFRVVALSIGMFTTAAVSAFLPPFFLVIFLYSFGSSLQEVALVASLLLAKIVALIMLFVVVSNVGIRIRFNVTKNLHTFRFVKSSTPYWSANVITNAATFYFDYQASGLGGGVVTALAYAKSVFMLPITVFITPILEISRTRFAQMQSIDDHSSLNALYNNLIRFVLYFSIPVAFFYFLFSHEIISALFQRGAFQNDGVGLTASFLSIYALSIPFTSVFLVNGRTCESYQRLLWPSIFGTLGNLLMIMTTYFLTHWLGHQGIPAAKVFIEVFYFLPFGFIAFHKFGGLPAFSKILEALCASLIAAILATIIFGFFIERYNGATFSLYYLVYVACFYCFIYIAVLLLSSSNFRSEFGKLLHI